MVILSLASNTESVVNPTKELFSEICWGRDSSVGIATVYGTVDMGPILSRGKILFLLNSVQTSSEVHLTFHLMSTWGDYPASE
jgi:hypothetical protein